MMAAAIVGLLLAAAGAFLLMRSSDVGDLPPPPDAQRQSAAIRDHLAGQYAAAQGAPRSAEAVGAYCVALHADMFYDAAGRCYARVIELAPEDWQWRYMRALLSADLGDADALTRDVEAVLAQAPSFAPAWLRLGDAAFKAGQHDAAEEAWTKVVELPEPERLGAEPVTRTVEVPAASHASLGIARIRLLRGDTAGAQAMLERMVAAGPPFSSAYRLLASIHERDGRSAEAADALARARRLPPFAPYADPFVDRLALESRNSTLLIRLASEADLGINGAWSEHLTRRALQFDPENPEVVIKLGRVLRTRGQAEEALTWFRRYQELVPGDPQIDAHVGSALSELGRYEEAEPHLRRAAAAFDDALAHYNLGLLLARTGRLDEAVKEYETALARDPQDVTARGNLAAVLVRRGEPGRAAEELRRVLAIDPENAVAHTNLGLLYAAEGDVGRARAAFREALRLNPSLVQAADALKSLGGV